MAFALVELRIHCGKQMLHSYNGGVLGTPVGAGGDGTVVMIGIVVVMAMVEVLRW